MRKILLLSTGGTIGCVPGADGLAPGMGGKELLQMLDMDTRDVECADLFSMDSSNIQPEEWLMIANAVKKAMESYDAVVITHGTDTMAYTSSMLSFLLQHIPIPVILTGAQYPMVYPDSDGRANLRNAVIAAREMAGGVYILFGSAIIRGCRAVKTRTTSLNAFESINAPYVGTVVDKRYIAIGERAAESPFVFYDKLVSEVALIKLVPGTSPQLIDACARCGVKGVVIEAFGLGGVHNFRRDHAEAIRELIESGIPVILTSQCLYEASSIGVYAVSAPLKRAGVISAMDMTTEAAVTKLMWALAQTQDIEKIRLLMQTDLCGEITAS